MLLLDLVGLERGEALEAQVEDRLRLLRESSNFSMSPSRAASGSREPRISSMTASRFGERDEQALEDVRARLARRSSCLVRRTTTSRWWST